MDLECFIGVIAKFVTLAQLEAIKNEFDEADPYNSCPVCGFEPVPVDDQGNVIYNDENIAKWQHHHDKDCPVLLLNGYLPSKQAEEANTCSNQ